MNDVLWGLGAYLVLLVGAVGIVAGLGRVGERLDRAAEAGVRRARRAERPVSRLAVAGEGRSTRPAGWRRGGAALRERHLALITAPERRPG